VLFVCNGAPHETDEKRDDAADNASDAEYHSSHFVLLKTSVKIKSITTTSKNACSPQRRRDRKGKLALFAVNLFFVEFWKKNKRTAKHLRG
jgi:hypothetical protein